MPQFDTVRKVNLIVEFYRRWMSLWERIAGPLDGDSYIRLRIEFDSLIRHYTEEHREYHGLYHLAYLFDLFDEYRHLAENPDAVELAIFFHDVIYDTCKVRDRPESNEELSRQNARDVMRSFHVAVHFQQEVDGIILVTLHVPGSAKTKDEMLMADLDWSPLGLTWEEFAKGGGSVMAEYVGEGRFSKEKFLVRRLKFLEAALEHRDTAGVIHPQYYLPEFRERFESNATRNLTRAIRELRDLQEAV